MRRTVAALLLSALVAAPACAGGDGEPGTIEVALPELDSSDLARATVTRDDLGDDWDEQRDAAPSTVQIGGRVGPANIPSPVAEATSGFERKEGAGVVSNTVYLLASEDVASAVMDAHDDADDETWTQKRTDGGSYTFRRTGAITGLSNIGDDVFAARLEVTITAAPGDEDDEAEEETEETAEPAETKRTIEYLVYRTGALVSFLVAEDERVGGLAREQADRLHDVVANAPAPTPAG